MTPGLVFAVSCLPVGFAVADLTGIRPLGGMVLLGLAIAAVAASRASLARSSAWLFVVLVCFAASHAVADTLGSWGAVAAVTVVAALAAAVLLRPSTAPTWR